MPARDFSATRAYQEKLLNLLGAREPLEILAQTPDLITALVTRERPDTLRTRPFPDKWTPCEIIGHLSDAEYVYGYRMRLILAEEQPEITSMDQELWVTAQHYNLRDPGELARQFGELRSWNLRLWRDLSPDDLLRSGVHRERGAESLGLMLRMNAGHDLSHIDQLTRYLAAIAGGSAA